jgi:hypothetical protein
MKLSWIHKLSGVGISLGLVLCCGTQQAHATTSGTGRALVRVTHANTPTVSPGCSIAAGSNDFRGTVWSSGTSCTITFATAYSSAPVCVASAQSTVNGDFSVGTPTTTSFFIAWTTATTTPYRNFYYHCAL